jgi:hypothetical protein
MLTDYLQIGSGLFAITAMAVFIYFDRKNWP